MSKRTTSTVLDGNHAFPAFYACYLLRSRATANSNRTYVGSTPNPPKRIRQHNGDLTQGAVTTSRYRPWEMQLIVHGFPSKLSALQFEWAWQKPELSRHLRHEEAHIFKKDAKRNWLQRKILVARVLLSVPPFSNLPLHVRFFNTEAQDTFQSCRVMSQLIRGKDHTPLSPVPHTITYVLDLGGVLGTTGQRGGSTPGVTSLTGPIDVKDTPLRQAAWDGWTAVENTTCVLCGDGIDIENHLSFAMCLSGCTAMFHLRCMARQSTSLLPKTVECVCNKSVEWGTIVKSCYLRREAADQARLSATKPDRKRKGKESLKARTASAESGDSGSEEE